MDGALVWRTREVFWVRQDGEIIRADIPEECEGARTGDGVRARSVFGTTGRKDLVFLTRFRILSYSISSSVSPWACLPTFCR